MAPPPPPPAARPQSSSYPKFDASNAAINLGLDTSSTGGVVASEQETFGADIPRRNSSDPTSSSSMPKKGEKSSMQNLRGAFLSKEERERQGLGKKGEKGAATTGGAMRSASVPGPLKSAMKARSNTAVADQWIPNSDPLPEDREALTGRLNHERYQLQKLADRAEHINEWIDMDLIVLTRLTGDLKTASDPSGSKAPSIRLTEAGSSSSSPVDPPTPITDDIVELNKRIECMYRWRKDLERSVFWHREEFRRIERALGRKKSGQSGAVQPAPARNVGFNDQESVDKKGQLGIAGGEEKEDEVDTEKNRNYLAGLEAKLQEGMSLEDASEAMREQDYARDRWTASLSRLPTQTEWEDLVGPKNLQKK